MTTYFNDLIIQYTNLKIDNQKNKNKSIYNYDIPETVKNIYAPENDCLKVVYGLKLFNVSEYDVFEFFIHICNNNKFNTKDEINQFFNFITKNISKYETLPEYLLNKICKLSNKIGELFIYALIEKIPIELLTNDILRKLLKTISTDIPIITEFVVFANKKGLEFDTKTIKLLKNMKIDMKSIKSKDININIQKYNSNMLDNIFNEKDFEICKQKFNKSLLDNNINPDMINLVFIQINKYLDALFEYKYIENIINMKLCYNIDIIEQDIYLISQFTLTEKLYDDKIIENIIKQLTQRNHILDFDNTTVVKYFRKPQTIHDTGDNYGWIKDCRYNFRKILENIITMKFSVKKYNFTEIKSIFTLFSKYVDDYIYNLDSNINKIKTNLKYYDDDEKKQNSQNLLKKITKNKEEFLNSIHSYDDINALYNGDYDKKYMKLILFEYNNVFIDLLKTKQDMIKLIDDDIISIIFALNLHEPIEYILDNKFIIDHSMTEYILYTPNIEIFLKTIYKYNLRLTNIAYNQLLSLVPKHMQKTLILKDYLIDDKDLSESISGKLNNMSLYEQIEYVHSNYNTININDVLNMKDNNGKTYILNYINKIKKESVTKNDKNSETIKTDEKVNKIIVKKVVKKIVKKQENNTENNIEDKIEQKIELKPVKKRVVKKSIVEHE